MLSPKYSAQLARDVYLIKDPNTQELFTDLYSSDFKINENTAHGGKIVMGCPTVLIGY